MNDKDATEKVLLSYDDVFADVINGFIFRGEQVVSPLDLKNDVVQTTYDHNDQIRSQERDISKFWEKGNVRLLLSGIENQTKPDKDMALRIIGYDGASYRGQLAADPSGVKTPRYPVVTIVLYFGEKEWDTPLSLKECFKNWDAVPTELRPYTQDYRIHVFDVPRMDPEDIKLFRSDFRIVADFFVQKYRTKDYQPSNKALDHVKQVCDLLSAVTGDKAYVEAYKASKESKGRGATNMCEIANKLKVNGRLEMLFDLVHDGEVNKASAAKRAGMSVEEFSSLMDKYEIKAKTEQDD